MTEEEKRARLSRMRLVALAVLAAMFAVFAASSMWQGSIPALQWLRAFSEAGIAGAIADWYAVVALFRHPLGLPMPHTAIIPRNKERIAESIGAFIETHFLTSQNVVERVVRFDFAAAASHWPREQTTAANSPMRCATLFRRPWKQSRTPSSDSFSRTLRKIRTIRCGPTSTWP
jgi:uncharacterized membrane-anchored protein YjiN (DUF445 family)